MDQSRDWKSEETARPDEANGSGSQTASSGAGGSPAPDSAQPPGGPGPSKPASSKASNELKEWIKALAIAAVLVIVIRWLLVSPFIVDGESMEPNFQDRERIIVNMVLYDFRKPKQGEVIVFHVPEENRDFIKRVIAVPGDTVKVEGDTVYVNGKPLDEPYLKEALEQAHAEGREYNNTDFEEGTVPEGQLFVMGDNRSNSKDSRMIGYIPMSRVVGRAELIFWPLKDIKYIGRGY
ncbi:signal peptidase I [Cohnella xylanilytica]|uniref:signal peptidase I n=1 Tax=Cohnella xylanilytica TaxID=557555 RepID=UPI001B077DAC|nr:signal peptidase I [Cohnella xylanilytica]GIO10835.1 signal peptidase I [Cohnella xylanilytica]